jgi:pimeloyl-ACP methyl ester carboxylesterase
VTPATTAVVEVNGGVLEYDVAGEGPAVAFLHPGLWDRRTWDDQFEAFAGSYRVLRLDARGYGRSSRPEPGRAYSHVEDLAAVMDAAGIDRAALVGCSMGGETAIDFALTHPARTSALVLVAAGVGGFGEFTPEEEAWWAPHDAAVEEAIGAGDLERARRLQMAAWAPLGTDDPAGARILAIALDNVHELTMDESGAASIEPPAAERLGEIVAPTLVLPADQDPPEMLRMARAFAREIPNARVVEIPRTDHVINMRRPAEFNEVVLAFLADVLG